MPEGAVAGLQTIEDGKVPKTRMQDALATQGLVRIFIKDDLLRSKMRATVDGLVDGNPPYNPAKLAKAGRRDACNVNWGTGRGYMESGAGAFYDLTNEAPGYVVISTRHGTPEQQAKWGQIMSEEADATFREDADFDDALQLSQNEMVLHGCGPLFFRDGFQVFPESVETGDLLVPERTRSSLNRWEVFALRWDYYPPELYESIENEAAATAVGWDVAYTKECISKPMSAESPQGANYNWEFYQQQLKNKSYGYRTGNMVIKTAHVFWKEFDGRWSHGIVQIDDTTGVGTQYLYLKVGRYADVREVLHPMYFDRGRGGFHHAVTGLGPKMCGPMTYENRLLCNTMDKAFAPKVLFKPTSTEATQKLQLATFGDYGILPAGTEVVQNPIQGYLTDSLAMFRASSELMRSNLSQYRQTVAPERPGNPATKYEKQLEASQQSALSNTTFSRYYRQLDSLYGECVRRLCNLNSTDERATAYQERCQDRGVPRECFGRVKSVVAVRVIGQGSPFMRQQVTGEMAEVIGRCSEDGQNNWLNDYIASRAGQSAVERYNPKPTNENLATDQRERAMNQVAGMKAGLHPTLTSSQDALTFAATFLQACGQAIASVQQGAPIPDVLAFLELAAPGAMAHLQRLSRDPFRKPMVEAMGKQLKQIGQTADKLKLKLKQQGDAEQEQKAQQEKVMNEAELAQFKAQKGEELRAQKAQHQMAVKTAVTKQHLAIQDATAASAIDRENKKAEAEAEANKNNAVNSVDSH